LLEFTAALGTEIFYPCKMRDFVMISSNRSVRENS
jgi:hypothetical protein